MKTARFFCSLLTVGVISTELARAGEGDTGPGCIMEPRVLTAATLNPVVSEGVIAFQYESGVIEQSDEPICETVDVEIAVQDDDGPIEGQLTHRRRFSAYLWRPEADGRVPKQDANPTLFIRWAVAIDDLGETIWGEPQTYPLNVLTSPTPAPNPATVTDTGVQLSPQTRWNAASNIEETCYEPRLLASWTVGEQPPGTKLLTAVEIIDGQPEGMSNNGTIAGLSGSRTRDYEEYAETYCFKLALKHTFLQNGAGITEDICRSHTEFANLLETGQRFCFAVPDSDVMSTRTANTANVQDSDTMPADPQMMPPDSTDSSSLAGGIDGDADEGNAQTNGRQGCQSSLSEGSDAAIVLSFFNQHDHAPADVSPEA